MKDPLSSVGKLYCGCLEDGGEEYEGGGGVWVGGAPGEGTARGGGGGMTHGFLSTDSLYLFNLTAHRIMISFSPWCSGGAELYGAENR